MVELEWRGRRDALGRVERVGTGRFEQAQTRFLHRLRTQELEDRLLGRFHAPTRLGERAVAQQLECLRIDGGTGVVVEHEDIVGLAALHDRLAAVLEQAVEAFGEVQPQHGPLVSERAVGDAPAAVELADEVLCGHDDVVEASAGRSALMRRA